MSLAKLRRWNGSIRNLIGQANPWNDYEFKDCTRDGAPLTDQPAIDTGPLDVPTTFTARLDSRRVGHGISTSTSATR